MWQTQDLRLWNPCVINRRQKKKRHLHTGPTKRAPFLNRCKVLEVFPSHPSTVLDCCLNATIQWQIRPIVLKFSHRRGPRKALNALHGS